MKNFLSLLLVFVMLLSLSACGKTNTKNSDHSSTSGQTTTDNTKKPTNNSGNKKEPTDSSTEATQTPTKEPTTTPGKDKEPISKIPIPTPEKDNQGSTEKPTTSTDPDTPNSSSCQHDYTVVSCTTPKMCTKCNYIAANALPHSYKNGKCSVCSRAEILTTFMAGDWVARTVKSGTSEQGEILSEFVLGKDKERYSSSVCYSNASSCVVSNGKIIYNDKSYHSDWYLTAFTRCVWEENEDTITITLENLTPVVSFILRKTSETQLTVISSTNTGINIAEIPVGLVFVKQ